MSRRLTLATIALALTGVLVTTSLSAQRGAAPTNDILWDSWGVPHIFAASNADAFYDFGWAQMENHADLMLQLYGQARGRGAEYFGEQYLDTDKYVRRMGIPERGKAWARVQSAEFAPLLSAFVDGANAYAKANPTRISRNTAAVLPITSADVLSHIQRVVIFSFVTSQAAIQGQTDRWERASNTWAVAPQRTAAGNALLLQNPHLPWSDFYTWMEAGITTRDVNAYGAALVGMPWLGIAFNDDLGWSHTVNAMDGADLYELELAAGGYRWNGAVRPFETTTEAIAVKQANGTMRQEPFTVKRSIHGPVVSEKAGKAVALRVVGLDDANVGEQYLAMIRARSLEEFQNAERTLQMPFFTTMYADKAGHIMHFFGGRTPVRPAGDYNWGGIVPGTTDATLWTKTLTYDELPKVIDPATGWLQNANDPPWTTTFPLVIDSSKYPSYVAPHTMSLRAQRSANLLEQSPKLTFDQMVINKMSTRMELADRLLDDLLPPAKAAGGVAAEAAAVLEQWDRCADADSTGAVLFEAWYRRAARAAGGAGLFAKRWSEADARTTPNGLRDPAAAVTALVGAANETKQLWGAIDVAWGVVHRLRVGTYDLPANGGPGDLGIFRVVNFEDDAKATGRAKQQVSIGGDSYVAVVEFTPAGPRAMSLLSYGNATQSGSPHVGDQLPLFAKKQLKPVWQARADVEKHLEKKETLRR
jgi:acyl-homoserine-lactone acylase